MKSFYLEFCGYWSDSVRDQVPDLPGIYCVYRSQYDVVNQRSVPIELLYIGESSSACEAVMEHQLRSRWEQALKPGDELCYSYAPLISKRKQALAALIFRHQPPLNAEHRYTFPFEPTALTVVGKRRFLQMSFMVPDEPGTQGLDELGYSAA